MSANPYGFEPNAERVRQLSRRMRSGLVDSLRYIAGQATGQVEFSPEKLEQYLAQAAQGPVSPQAFCLYHDLVVALEADDFSSASNLLNELPDLSPPKGGPVVLDLPNPQKTVAGRRYARFIETDFSAGFVITPPAPTASANCRTQIKDAFALMDAGDPELAAEIRALVLEIILAAGTEDPKKMTFDGASAFMLWGAIMINANRNDGEIGMVQMLAHESAHDLLFGFCADGPLVENSPDELYPSPLRVDPRPMEGIYHATFVTARMHRAVKKLIDAGILAGKPLEKARKDLAENARLFAKGIDVVNRYGKLSPMGEALMRGASDYMAAAA
jgi:hypothetical protein